VVLANNKAAINFVHCVSNDMKWREMCSHIPNWLHLDLLVVGKVLVSLGEEKQSEVIRGFLCAGIDMVFQVSSLANDRPTKQRNAVAQFSHPGGETLKLSENQR